MNAPAASNCRVALTCLDHGHRARQILRQCRDLKRLYVVTSGNDLALRKAGIAALLADQRVRLVRVPAPDQTPSALWPLFEQDSMLFVEGRVGVFIPDAQRRVEKSLCAEIEQCALNYTRTAVSRAALRITRGWHILANSLINLSRLGREDTLRALRGAAADKPVVVVGAGPSLDRSVDALNVHRRRIVIVACDGARNTLAQAGILPDLVVSTDDSEKVWRYFAGATGPHRNVPVVSLLHGSWPVLRHHPGRIFFARGNTPVDQAVDDDLGPVPFLDSGMCVGHAALETAFLLGGNPILLTGFDLGYDGARFHPENMPLPYFHQHPPPPENLLTVPGNNGELIRTELSMAMYLREFERRIAAAGRTVLNATAGGAQIAGVAHVDLGATLASLPTLEHAFEPAAPRRENESTAKARLASFRTLWAGRLTAYLKAIQTDGWTGEATEGNLDRLPGLLVEHSAALDLLSVAENPVLHARLESAWDSWRQDHRPPDRSLDVERAARSYLEHLGELARLVLSLFAIDSKSLASSLLPNRVLVVPGLETPDPALTARIDGLLSHAGLEHAVFHGAPDDVPGLWSAILNSRAGIVLTWNGAALPACWAIPGAACIDIVTRPPDNTVKPEHWLPGYAMIGADLGLASAWRIVVPADRGVFTLNGGHTLYSAGPLRRDWQLAELVRQLRRETGQADTP